MKSSSSREALYHFLSAAAAYQNSTIWLMDTSGNISIDTSGLFEESEDPEKLPEMDPGEFTGSYYQIGTLFRLLFQRRFECGQPSPPATP